MVTTPPKKTYKRLSVPYITESMPLVCFGHTCGHHYGGALQEFLNQCTNIRY